MLQRDHAATFTSAPPFLGLFHLLTSFRPSLGRRGGGRASGFVLYVVPAGVVVSTHTHTHTHTGAVWTLFAPLQLSCRLVVGCCSRLAPGGSTGPRGRRGCSPAAAAENGGLQYGIRSNNVNEVMHLMQGCHCALLQKLCKMPKSQTLSP